MKESGVDPIIAIIFASLMLLFIGIFLFIVVIFYQRKKIKNFKERQRIRAKYERSVLKAKVEIREETLKYVGQELHDNIGQVLSLIKLYLSKPSTNHSTDVNHLIEQAISDIRQLSQDLNISRVEQYSLADFIDQELNKVQKAGEIETHFEVGSRCESMDNQKKLMISRVFQECINNIIKHAEAANIHVKLEAKEDHHYLLTIRDDGIGFKIDKHANGSGLINIHDRTKMIGGHINMTSSPGNGTHITIKIPN